MTAWTPSRLAAAQPQRGVIVFIALIALLILSLAALSLLRSTDTAGVISGNVAFKQAATSAADTGAERAFTALPALAAADVDTSTPHKYSRTMLIVDADGVPTLPFKWEDLPCYDNAGGATPIDCSNESTYRVQYVIDRLCTIAPVAGDSLTQLTSKCVAGQPFAAGSAVGADTDSHAQTTNVFGGLTPPPAVRPTIHYRITVRVLGPRNASSIVQTTVELPFG
ncbi:hypothetical protein QTI66_24190 [Variovorax sp. J22R133]|uniref:hypothetical protein n=1 Tax=Variovorax brevis TaxID=3053503 RepID=UPI002578B721|nr:hypothetical protein [Variovorax sp. J22R133]MDM0115272.1 hypothetical protein [Variovorax sp. J22R133]